MDLYGMHQGQAQANAVSGEQAAYNQGVSDDNIQSLKNLKARQGTEIEEDDIKDVKDAANLLCRFLRLHRRTAKTVRFKGSFADAR